tara:strand:- start:82 stop:1341 length:1260 start_codon:yes stop_codon:yes gene_type:complete
MAEKEKPVADNETGKIKVKAKKENQPDNSETKGNVTKVKAKMKQPAEDLSEAVVHKVNLDEPIKKEEDAVSEQSTNEIPVQDKSEVSGEVQEENIKTTNEEPAGESGAVQNEETPVVEEITTDKVEEQVKQVEKEVIEAVTKSEEQGVELPENIQKLVGFMQETGGDINDYVALNQDYEKLDNHTLLREYYKSTKPHLSEDEIEFIMDDTFAYDEEDHTETEIKRKKLAMKEQVASARQHLESVKSKYYEEIKSGSKLTTEQQEAINFFNKYNEQSESYKESVDIFKNKTENVFNNEFKGFEYNVGDKRFRFNVKDANKIKETQSDINNFVKKFLNKDNKMEDAAGYHKGLFTAMNADQIANHFYEQGKADALKDSIAKSKNVSMDPRQAHNENVNTSGYKVRALNNDDSGFKFKIKRK